MRPFHGRFAQVADSGRYIVPRFPPSHSCGTVFRAVSVTGHHTGL